MNFEKLLLQEINLKVKLLNQEFLIAGIGRSFTIFNTRTKTSLFTVENAHGGKINHIDVVYDG